MNPMHRSIDMLISCLLLAMCLAVPAAASAAPGTTLTYVSDTLNFTDAYLIDWQAGGRAHLVAKDGNRDGSVTESGARSVITLDQPFSVQHSAYEPDSCGDFPLVQQNTLQVAVTTLTGTSLRGTSSVALAGTLATLTGCDTGKVVPNGSVDVPYLTVRQLPMLLRPPVDDLKSGVALAGPSDQSRDVSDPVAADVLTLMAGDQGLFASSGNVISAGFNAERWLVVALPAGGGRAYTRISVDPDTGAEVWLDADWYAGQPSTVRSVLMVKPGPGAGFGNRWAASRIWQSGLFIGSRSPFFISLFPNGTGDRLLINLDAGTATHTPTNWAISGPNIVQSRPAYNGNYVRTWRPLLNGGGKAHFVMEDEMTIADTGDATVDIPARVNYYVDRGAATQPSAPTTAATAPLMSAPTGQHHRNYRSAAP